jgi:hypothetical protein
MKYEEAKSRVKRHYIVNDGFTGRKTKVGLCYDPETKTAIEVNKCGCYRATTDEFETEKEMLLIFDNALTRSIVFPQCLYIL